MSGMLFTDRIISYSKRGSAQLILLVPLKREPNGGLTFFKCLNSLPTSKVRSQKGDGVKKLKAGGVGEQSLLKAFGGGCE